LKSKIKLKFFSLTLILISILIVLNKPSTQLIGINFKVSEYQVPLYLKLYNFYGRHLNYGSLVSRITKNSQNDQEKVIHISKWITKNIQKLPDGMEIVDSHPITIFERRLGVEDQFSDLLSVMLVYAGLKSFYIKTENGGVLTYFKLNGNWSIIDPYYGIMFLNSEGEIASLNDLKESNWSLFTLDFEPINMKNFKSIFNEKFYDINQVNESYMTQIYSAPSQEIITMTNKFNLGGRSFIQSPFGRLQFMLIRFLKKISKS
jgi:hypothetical protein